MLSQRTSQAKRIPSTDIEMQVEQYDKLDGNAERHENLHMVSLQAFYDFTPEQMRQIRAIPTVISWCRHLEDCFRPLLNKDYSGVWSTLGVPPPRSTSDCWILLRAVSKVAADIGDEGHSIEDVRNMIEISPGVDMQGTPPAALPDTQDSHCLIAIFATLCWSSMIFRPDLAWDLALEAPCLAVHQSQTNRSSLKMTFVERPIPVVFRNFQKALDHRRLPRKPTRDDGTTLFVSSFNYHSLRTIGKVRLIWIDNLSGHLTFEPKTRTLHVFRFPSFCALMTILGDRSVLFEKLIHASFSIDDEIATKLESCSLQLSQEVLMSYRLLFGQSRAARGAGKALLQKLAAEHSYDGLLVDLCTKPQKKIKQLPASFWPISCRDFDMRLQEAESYSSQDDFPIFGSRLAVLQEFNLKQQPSKLRDLWRDRRNPLQWYTFWAVLIIGGISNIIAILQLVVAIIQIKV
ncbi:hypothetical protein K431DRAFT_266215 [Polychaeton citri CBS 116435]|uniref:Uncharacterized protein n=1 Tax=Polychaeton citri CBS 116435 TaxID=1314669 RepID=A0A9P4Q8P0_9PEZI|nr:hypothetical protein K431DRAFT_266215 [Polychaeton citri CBS 116435]